MYLVAHVSKPVMAPGTDELVVGLESGSLGRIRTRLTLSPTPWFPVNHARWRAGPGFPMVAGCQVQTHSLTLNSAGRGPLLPIREIGELGLPLVGPKGARCPGQEQPTFGVSSVVPVLTFLMLSSHCSPHFVLHWALQTLSSMSVGGGVLLTRPIRAPPS